MSAPSGWHPDPENPQVSERFWDGENWTGQTRPRMLVPPQSRPGAPSPNRQKKRRKWPWIAAGTVVAFWAIGNLTYTGDKSKEDAPAPVVATTQPTTTPAMTASTTTNVPPSPTSIPSTTSAAAIVPLVPAIPPAEATTTAAYVPPPEPVYTPPPAPAYTPPPAPKASSGTVHPGSFCSNAGSGGISETGKAMVCATAKDGRLRWQGA